MGSEMCIRDRSKVICKSTKEYLDGGESVQCIIYFGVSGLTNPAITVAVTGDEPRPARLQPSLAHFSLVKDLGRSRPWSQRTRIVLMASSIVHVFSPVCLFALVTI